MRKGIIRTVSVVVMLSLACLMLASCGEKPRPDFVLEARVDEDLVASYRAYFELNSNSVREVKEIRYKVLILDDETEYSEIGYDTYSFKAKAITKDPTGWTITEDPANKETYGTDTLVKLLNKMRPPLIGDLDIRLYTFDNYTIFEVSKIEDSEVVDISTAVFYKTRLIKKPDSVSLKAFSKVYKHDN